MKNKIIIIGNGFDLYNELPTSYSDFYKYVIKNNLLTETIKNVYSFVDYEDAWNHFEENLISIDCDYVRDVLSPGKFAVAYTGKLRKLSIDKTKEDLNEAKEELYSLFVSWINSIRVYNIFNFVNKEFNGESIFINFNYTKTLELLYNVPTKDILHIHGDQANIVIGCGDEAYKFLMCDAKTYRGHPAYVAIRDFAKKNIKPVENLTKTRLIPFLNNFEFDNKIEIYVLGHSKNRIDKGYFSFLNQRFNNAIWNFSIFDSEDKKNTRQFVDEIEIKEYYFDSLESFMKKLIK